MTSQANLSLLASSPEGYTRDLASLPDFVLLSLASDSSDINLVRMIVQELYLRLELRAWTDLPPVFEGEEDDYPTDLHREPLETDLVRMRRESARGY